MKVKIDFLLWNRHKFAVIAKGFSFFCLFLSFIFIPF